MGSPSDHVFSDERRPATRALSTPVVIAFFLITNAVFYFMAGSCYLHHRLQANGTARPAMITHKWRAARWSDEVYIGYAYVDDDGVQHNGSARIRAASAGFFDVGQPVEILVDLEMPQRSLLVDRSHLSRMEALSGNGATAVLTGIFCAFGWWLMLSRMWRRWRGLRQPPGARQAPAG